MTQKWRIILGICMVIAVCLPMVSASMQVSTLKTSLSKPSLDQVKMVQSTQYTLENVRIHNELPDIQTYYPNENIRKPDFSILSTKPAISETTPKFVATRMIIPYSDIYIMEEEAIGIALARFPGVVLLEPIKANLEQIHAPAYPLATNPCWVVYVTGCHPERWGTGYGGVVFIDAVTGEVLYMAFLM